MLWSSVELSTSHRKLNLDCNLQQTSHLCLIVEGKLLTWLILGSFLMYIFGVIVIVNLQLWFGHCC